MQLGVLSILVEQTKAKNSGAGVSVFMEHFSLEHQPLLDRYQCGDLSEEELYSQYRELGEEGFTIEEYGSILRYAKDNCSSVRLKGGFVPRRFGKLLVQKGEDEAYGEVIKLGFMQERDKMAGSPNHYDFFESLISGRNLNGGKPPGDNFRRIFPAQVLKDCVMASTVRTGLSVAGPDDKFLVIAGSGHLDYGLGVPERVNMFGELSQEEECIITVRDEDQMLGGVQSVDRFEKKFPGDFIFIYRGDWDEEEEEEEENVKDEVSKAYDGVASTAQISGNSILAAKVMS